MDQSFYEFSAKSITGEVVNFSKYKDKVVLIENVASLWGTTVRDYTQMNLLTSRFGSENFAILGFPCNQFGHQENSTDAEIPKMLRHVRPGNNFEPKIEMFSKIEVNGEKAHPLFQFLRKQLPKPQDNPEALMTDPKLITWTPVTRTDVSWNFEKFLVDANGQPFRRYSPKFETINVETDIKSLLNGRRGRKGV